MKKTASSDPTALKPSLKLSSEFEKAAKPVSSGRILAPNGRRVKMKGNRFVITCAQNNTDVHEGFLKALETYCKENKAQLLIPRITYNKTAYENKDGKLGYDPKLEKYFFDEPAQLAPRLVLCGELDISPTAADPLSGFDNYCQGDSGIIAHPKVAMKSLPSMEKEGTRFMYTTGACTQRNYIQKKAGQKAEFHHNYAALVVEVDDDGAFFVRQISADESGAFYDLTDRYLPNGKVQHNQRVASVTLGDIHLEKLDPQTDAATFGKGGFMDTLKPKYAFYEDLIDFTSRNHHNIKNPFFLLEQHMKGATVENELNNAGKYLKERERKDRQDYVVESNHDEAYARWIKEADGREDPHNMRFWFESGAELARQIEAGKERINIFEWAVRRNNPDLKQVTFLQENDSAILHNGKLTVTKRGEDDRNDNDRGGIECAIHGHTGPNGAKGSPRAYTKLSTKAITGHTHAAGIIDGVATAGVTGKRDMIYNVGASSWSPSHVVGYDNDKVAVVTFRGDRYKAMNKPSLSFELGSHRRHATPRPAHG